MNDFEKITGLEDNSFEDIEGEADTLAGLILEIKGELPKKNRGHTGKILKTAIDFQLI